MDDAVLDALRRAVHAAPWDLDLAAHLADCLLQQGLDVEALQVAAAVLSVDPAHAAARATARAALAPDGVDRTAEAPQAVVRRLHPARRRS